jgi:predicted SprT family Zn-dependent metalloprotease
MDDEQIRALIAGWGVLWGVPDLADTVSVAFSGRLKRSLGRCRPAAGRIALQARLRHQDELLAEVLCHEAAHVAAYRLSNNEALPHGSLWHDLVRAAGLEPRVRRSASGDEAAPPPRRSSRFQYEHRCPICHTVRYARRPVPAWRCAECLDSGLSGELVVTRAADRRERDA